MSDENSQDPAALKILLVCDDEQNFVSLWSFLKKSGARAVQLDHTCSHQEALGRVTKISYDLVLCDYQSGNGTALELLHAIHRERSELQVIFLSDYIDEAAAAAAVRAAVANRFSSLSSGDSGSLEICRAIGLYCEARQQHRAEDMVRKLWRTVEQIADMVMITDCSGVVEYVNPAFEALTGYSRQETIGQTLRILKSKRQSPELYREMWQTILQGKIFRGVITNRKKNGEVFLAEKTITPLRDAGGRITHFISTDRDITERQKLEAQLNQAQKMDAIGRLAGGVAHDFNNLIMVMSSYAELMLEAMSAEHPLRRNAQEIMAASARAADLTRQLLTFGRKQIRAFHVLDLNAALREIGRTLPRLIGEDIQIKTIFSENAGQVRADPVQIEQIVMNLSANARDAMPRGGTLTIETADVHLEESALQKDSMIPAGDYVLPAVTDSGEGISAEHLSHIFEPFYSTKDAGKGTGLGLATVYGIVKQNGGSIWVYSEPGMGTTFKIYLPRVHQEPQQPKPTPTAAPPARGWETLLLVEDAAAVRHSEREFLELHGYKILEAENGSDAVQVAQEYAGVIHLMITDVVMPQLGGIKLAEQLAAKRPQMKVLFVSGYAEHTLLQHGAVSLDNCFLQKPFSLSSFAHKIRAVLQHESTASLMTASSR